MTLRRVATIAAASVVLVVVFGLVVPRLVDVGAVWDQITDLSAGWIAALLAAATLNIATFAPPWMAALPGLGFRQALVLTQTSTALSSVVPGGDAVGMGVSYAMLRAWRFRDQAVATAVAVTTLWNQLINVGLPLLAVALLTLSGEKAQPLLVTASLIGLCVLAAVVAALVALLRSDRQAARIGGAACRVARPVARLVRRGVPDLPSIAIRFRHEARGLIAARWLAITAAQLAGHLSVFAVLLVALRAVGVDGNQVSALEALAAWSLVRLLTAVPLTPGGLGVVELGLSGGLVAFGGHSAQVVAAVLLYRALTFLPPIFLGTVLGVSWRRHAAPRTPLAR